MTKLTIRVRVSRGAAAIITVASLFAGAAAGRFATASRPVLQQAQHTQFATTGPEFAKSTTQKLAVPPHKHRWYQLGLASWYGSAFQGRPTASGEEFDMNDLTAAHRSLPLGTLLRVTNLRNHRDVVVRVNDRGPVPENRVIDLSYAAAQQLSFEHRGLAQVKLEVLPPTPTNVARLAMPVVTQPQ